MVSTHLDDLDVPEQLPEDAFLKTTKGYFDNIRSGMVFEK